MNEQAIGDNGAGLVERDIATRGAGGSGGSGGSPATAPTGSAVSTGSADFQPAAIATEAPAVTNSSQAGAPSERDASTESFVVHRATGKTGTGARRGERPAPPADTPAASVPRAERPDRRPVVAAILGAVVLLFALLSRWPLDAKLRLVGAACCAQSPARTLSIGGSLMPLDARDAGIYLTGLLTLAMAVLAGRGHASRLPPGHVTALLAGLFVAMVLDGVNSTLGARGLHPLYHTTNTIRLITGAGAGLALALLGAPMVNRVVWRRPGDEAFAASYGELGGFIAAAAVLVALLLSPRPWLYYPLSVLSILGVLAGWGLINSAVVAVATRRERKAVTLADGGLLLLAGVALTLCEVAAIDVARLSVGH